MANKKNPCGKKNAVTFFPNIFHIIDLFLKTNLTGKTKLTPRTDLDSYWPLRFTQQNIFCFAGCWRTENKNLHCVSKPGLKKKKKEYRPPARNFEFQLMRDTSFFFLGLRVRKNRHIHYQHIFYWKCKYLSYFILRLLKNA